MNYLTRIAARVGTVGTRGLNKPIISQVNVWPARRFTSWITFEDPNPSLYIDIYRDASHFQRAATYDWETAENFRSLATVSEAETETTATISEGRVRQKADEALWEAPAVGRQVATSTTTTKSPGSPPLDSRFLSTTLIKVPGSPSTWGWEENDSK